MIDIPQPQSQLSYCRSFYYSHWKSLQTAPNLDNCVVKSCCILYVPANGTVQKRALLVRRRKFQINSPLIVWISWCDAYLWYIFQPPPVTRFPFVYLQLSINSTLCNNWIVRCVASERMVTRISNPSWFNGNRTWAMELVINSMRQIFTGEADGSPLGQGIRCLIRYPRVYNFLQIVLQRFLPTVRWMQ